MTGDAVEQIANAILYEGYLLYPYRASALKNQRRWNFGVVYPRAYSEERGEIEPWKMQTECLCQAGPLSTIQIKVRFLRLAENWRADGPPQHVQDAEETEIDLPERHLVELMPTPLIQEFFFPGCFDREGPVNRRQQPLTGIVKAQAAEGKDGAWKITVQIENVTPPTMGDELLPATDQILLQSLVSTHAILRLGDGEFVSMTDPPEALREAVAKCSNQGTWPVLVGDGEKRNTLLSSPIILYDYPQIAPESPGDLFDGTEIDEILTLRILTMTDEEKEEVRKTDPRARQLLERTEALPPGDFLRLHGVLRAVGSPGGV
jgi:hypothetical protein